jgi:hypothetical protein
MTNTYRAISDRARAIHGEGVLELNLSPSQEADDLNGGHLEIVPRAYRALSDNFAAAEQGKTFKGVFLVENEAALIQGGHIERVTQPKTDTVIPAPKKKED